MFSITSALGKRTEKKKFSYNFVGYMLLVDQVKEDEIGKACSTNGEKRNAYRILVAKPEGKRPLGRPRRKWVDNIKVDIREMGWYGLDRSGSG
jgi:hypothetical protein